MTAAWASSWPDHERLHERECERRGLLAIRLSPSDMGKLRSIAAAGALVVFGLNEEIAT